MKYILPISLILPGITLILLALVTESAIDRWIFFIIGYGLAIIGLIAEKGEVEMEDWK